MNPRLLSGPTFATDLIETSVDALKNANIQIEELKPSSFSHLPISNLLVFNGPFYFSFGMKGSNKKKVLDSPILRTLTIAAVPEPNQTESINEPMLDLPALQVEREMPDAAPPTDSEEPKMSGPDAEQPKMSRTDSKQPNFTGDETPNFPISDPRNPLTDLPVRPVEAHADPDVETSKFTVSDPQNAKTDASQVQSHVDPDGSDSVENVAVPVSEALADFFRKTNR